MLIQSAVTLLTLVASTEPTSASLIEGAQQIADIGDLASLRAQLLDLGWGPLEEHDADGNLVRTIGP